MRVLFLGTRRVIDPWFNDFVAAIGGRFQVDFYDPARPRSDQLRGVGVVVDHNPDLGTKEMIDAAANAGVKLWQIMSIGVDSRDVGYLLQKGIWVANIPGPVSCDVALAEHALFLMLAVAKQYSACQRNLRSGIVNEPITGELCGKTLGLVGLGASGRELAKRAWALGMRILGIDVVEIPRDVCRELHVEFLGGPSMLDRLLADSDYLSIHVPLTRNTKHMIDRHAFDLMKATAVVINVSRGGIIDEGALVEALRCRRIKGAGLDVFEEEPVNPTHPLLQQDNVVATPHNAGCTWEASRKRGKAAAENVARIAQGLGPLYQITVVT